MKPTGKDVDPKDRAFGQRIQKIRKERQMTQQELAAALGKTPSWMSQVERGVQPVQRMDVLQDIADALGVSVQQLRPGVPASSVPETPPRPLSYANDLERARQIISGHPAPDVLLGTASDTDVPAPLDQLGAEVDDVWELTHAGEFAALSATITGLLPKLERTARTVGEEHRAEAQLLLARTYQALAAAFVRQNEPDAAWVAADRAIRAAELSGDPLHVCAGVYRMVQAFVRLKNLGQAEHAARTAIDALSQRTDLGPEGLSVLGSLHLVLALVHARSGERSDAKAQIERARVVAAQIGEDRNDFNLEFGPTNVEIQAVSTAIDLGDAGEALDIGLAIDAESLSPERRGRLLMDLGRAHAQRRHTGEAVDCLLRAEALCPETVLTHVASRKAIKDLVLISAGNPPDGLIELAERADAME